MSKLILAGAFGCFLATGLHAQSPGVLYTWDGTSNVQDWFKNFGENSVRLVNRVPGELTIIEGGVAGAGLGLGHAVSDGFNTISESLAGLNAGGIDLSGLLGLEWEMGHDGTATVQVQFFVQATPASTYLALGPDVAVRPGVDLYRVPIEQLTPAEQAYVRTIGINVRAHPDQGNLNWTIRQVRAVGAHLSRRRLADHTDIGSDRGLHGAYVNFNNKAVQGNDGRQNQTGLSHDGRRGALQWLDGREGAAIAWGNGTAFLGNSFNERPTDLSQYGGVEVTMAATAVEGECDSLGVQYYVQSGAEFEFRQIGEVQRLPCDGEFHTLEYRVADTDQNSLLAVQAHGIHILDHSDSVVAIAVRYMDWWIHLIRPRCNCYVSANCPGDTNSCDYGPGGPWVEDICNYSGPKPEGTGPGCSQPFGEYGQCDGRCTEGKGSNCWILNPDILFEIIRLWSESIISVAESGGGEIDREMIAIARRMTLVQSCIEFVGRHVGGLLVEVMGDRFGHPDDAHPFEEHRVPDLSDEPCVIEAMRIITDGLLAELREGGASRGIGRRLLNACPEIQKSAPGCVGLDLEDCLDARVRNLAVFMGSEPVGEERSSPPVGLMIRGDCNVDGTVDISDVIATLGLLFLGEGDIRCDDACDSNDDGQVDISDPITTLGVLFRGRGRIPPPGMNACGVDPTDDNLTCESFAACRAGG